MAKQGTGAKVKVSPERQQEIEWLREEVKYLELLAKYYSYSLQLSKLQSDFMKQEEARRAQIAEMEAKMKENADTVTEKILLEMLV
jgi:hypothetical protein